MTNKKKGSKMQDIDVQGVAGSFKTELRGSETDSIKERVARKCCLDLFELGGIECDLLDNLDRHPSEAEIQGEEEKRELAFLTVFDLPRSHDCTDKRYLDMVLKAWDPTDYHTSDEMPTDPWPTVDNGCQSFVLTQSLLYHTYIKEVQDES